MYNKMINNNMYVIKRDGQEEEVSFDKVLKRIKYLSEDKYLILFKTNIYQKI